MQPVRDDGPLGDDRTEYEQACDEVLAGARRSVRIFSADLDTRLLNRERVSELLVRLARHNPAARIRILINDPATALEQGHRLIYLARRLPSFVTIRVASAQAGVDDPESWLLADDTTLLWRPDFRQLRHGLLHRHDRQRSGALMRLFDERWQQARQDNALRQLHL